APLAGVPSISRTFCNNSQLSLYTARQVGRGRSREQARWTGGGPLQRRDGGDVMDARMMICPTCGARFEAGTSYCPHDGTKLEPLPQPAHPDEGQAEWRVQPRVGELLSRGWELLKADAGKYFLIYLALGIPTIIPGIDSLWTVVSLIFILDLPLLRRRVRDHAAE